MPLNTDGLTIHDISVKMQRRFTKRVDRSGGPDACWPWLMRVSRGHGYGMAWTGHKETTAHRVAYVLWVGPIAPGMTVDHRCRNRICCNPAHLRQITNELNAKDNGQNLKTHCPQGHPYDQANTYLYKGKWRRCRTCAGAQFGRGPTVPRSKLLTPTGGA